MNREDAARIRDVEDRGEWHVWGMSLAKERADIARAIVAFEADPCHDSSLVVTRWLHEQSFDDRAAVTHLLVLPKDGDADPDIVAFVALASAEVLVDARTSDAFKAQTQRMPATYVAYIGRHRNYPGTGRLALLWASSIARDVGKVQANLLLVLQAADDATAHMWAKRYGFREAGEERRLWAAFPSPKT